MHTGVELSYTDPVSEEFLRLRGLAESIGFVEQSIDQLVDPSKRLKRDFHPDFPALIRLFSFPDPASMVGERWLNWHDHYELILPLEGAGIFRTGTQQVNFEPGDLLVVDHDKLHGMVSLEGDHRSLVIHFLPELIEGSRLTDCNSVYLWPFRRRPAHVEPIVRKDSQEGIEVLRAAVSLLGTAFPEPAMDDAVNQAGTKLQLLLILEAVRKHLGLTSETVRREAVQEKHRKQIRRVMDHLHRHLGEKILLEDAAQLAGMSLSHFKTVFREVAGMPFSNALIRIRVSEAARLLRETDLAIAEISFRVGFSDQSHLVRSFRGIMGETPSAYRRKYLASV